MGQFFWDPHTSSFRGYVKLAADVNGLRRRAVGRTTAGEIDAWTEPVLVLAPDTLDDWWAEGVQRTHFYGMSAFPYERGYLALLWIFRATDAEGYWVGPVHLEIASSSDGARWAREEGERPPILPLGPPGSWDAGQIYTSTRPVRDGDRLLLYYGGCDTEHGTPLDAMTCGIGLATLRKDGFASLNGGSIPGEMVTKMLVDTGPRLRVNYAAQAGAMPAGLLQVEVLDSENRVLSGYGREDCDPLTGDSTDQTVSWRGVSRLPEGAPLRFRFVIRNASVYSFTAGRAADVLD